MKHTRNTDATFKDTVEFRFVEELWVTGFLRFEFNRHVFARTAIHRLVNVAERTTADLTKQAKFILEYELARLGARCHRR